MKKIAKLKKISFLVSTHSPQSSIIIGGLLVIYLNFLMPRNMNKSLKDNTGEKDKINDIRLSLNTPKGSQTIWVLVEGEDDCKIYPQVL